MDKRDKRNRLSIPIGDLRKRLERQRVEPSQPLTSVVRMVLIKGLEVLEAQTRKSSSIAELLRNQDLEMIATDSQLPLDIVQAIAAGTRPSDEQLVGLARGLEIPSEELLEIRKRTFGNGQHRGRVLL